MSEQARARWSRFGSSLAVAACCGLVTWLITGNLNSLWLVFGFAMFFDGIIRRANQPK